MKEKLTTEELDSMIMDLNDLGKYEENAEKDLAIVEKSDRWKVSEYEEKYLPRLRLAGYENNSKITLQNSADLHIHTQWSDGDNLDKILEQAIKSRLDAIAITDHDEIEGALEARRRVHKQRLKIAIVPGIEVSSRDGHIGALFVTKKIPKGLSASGTIDIIHKMGGLAVAHHPYAPKIIEKLLRVKLGCGDLIKELPFDAIECTNAIPGYASRYNLQACQTLAEHHIRIAVTGSSDAHLASFVGKGKTYYAGNMGLTSLYNNMKNGFTQGAETYWKFTEKILYRTRLIKAIFSNLITKKGSIN